MNIQPSAGPVFLFLAGAMLSACSSIPSPKMLVASSANKLEVQALAAKTGAVADVLTVSGEEHYFVISPSADGILGGKRIDPALGHTVPEDVAEPFGNLAIVYYLEQPKKKRPPVSGYEDHRNIPNKYAYPKLPSSGAKEKSLSCAALSLELARAEAIRWFAREQGAMGYTEQQAALRHITNGAEYTAITALVVLAIAAGGYVPNFSPAPPPDPNRSLKSQIGEENLRWSVTHADARIIGLLEIRRDKGCAEQPTLVDGNSDLKNLVALDALVHGAAVSHLSADARMHEQTRLLDELGPLPLPEGSNHSCGALFNCPIKTVPLVSAAQ
ncbi:MAG TPA: hypothetical protein VGI65_03715 [Steroidobacteraceae bacterium]|jgi:hypothetical protein